MQQHYVFLGQHNPIHEYSVFIIANVVEAHCCVTDSKWNK